MDSIIFAILGGPALVLAACTVYQTLFMVVALLSRHRLPIATGVPRTRFVVLIPAHNEGSLIAETVQSLLGSDYPRELLDVRVIADNCTDDTAALSRRAGATCHERHDLNLRGKPYALDWMIGQLDVDRYDAVVIIDGDTIVSRRFLRAMDAHLAAGETAIQGYYGVMNPGENWLTRLSVLPAAVKFRLHFPGKRALGLSCPLAGNGMCFAIDVIRRFGWKAFSLTENWEYYVLLTLNGYVTTSAADAVIYAQVARSLKLGETQRMRWMKGQIDTLRRYWRQLLGRGLREPSLVKLDALIEIARPSHANLAFMTLVFVGVSATVLSFGVRGAAIWLLVGAVSVALQVVYFFAGFAVERPPLKTWLALFMAPPYLLWKASVSLKGLLSLSDSTWVKTTRN